MGKKVLSLFLATVLLLSIFSTSVFALTSANPVGWEYEVSDSKATITAFSGIDSTVNVPESIDGYSVQGIAANVLNSGTLVNVYIPSNCTSIDSSAIYAGATVYGIKGSAAETYADANSLSFVSIADSASYSTYVGKTITVNVNSEATIDSKNSLTTINGNSVKAVASGTEELSVSLPNGIVGTIKIVIKEAPASISNVPATLKLYVGEKYQLSPKFSNGTYDETFNYGTTASAYAVVSNSGLIQAKGAGTVNIIVASAGLKATCVLTVLKKPTKVKLSATDILIGVGERNLFCCHLIEKKIFT